VTVDADRDLDQALIGPFGERLRPRQVEEIRMPRTRQQAQVSPWNSSGHHSNDNAPASPGAGVLVASIADNYRNPMFSLPLPDV
jgi:hypothetical protein